MEEFIPGLDNKKFLGFWKGEEISESKFQAELDILEKFILNAIDKQLEIKISLWITFSIMASLKRYGKFTKVQKNDDEQSQWNQSKLAHSRPNWKYMPKKVPYINKLATIEKP